MANEFVVRKGLIVSGSSNITGSLSFTNGGVTGSLFGTASWANNAVSSSFATTASAATSITFTPATASYAANADLLDGLNSTVFATTGSNRFTASQVITGSLNLTGTATASAMIISGSGTQRLRVIGSGAAQPIFSIEGSQGELFSITDSLSGSLFSVSDISGLPILEVFSDDTVLMGDYLAPALHTTKKFTLTTGSNVIYSVPTASYDSIHIEYNIKSASNGRAGNFIGTFVGTTAQFTDASTLSVGSTANVKLEAFISGANLVVTGSVPTNTWTLKTIIRAI